MSNIKHQNRTQKLTLRTYSLGKNVPALEMSHFLCLSREREDSQMIMIACEFLVIKHSFDLSLYLTEDTVCLDFTGKNDVDIQGGSNMTGTDCV
jgi:hypothetical protein